jgi:hypothetical protein
MKDCLSSPVTSLLSRSTHTMEAAAPYAISATDRSGLIVIVETLFMSWMIMVSLIRLYMRLAINGPVQIDDLVVFAGSVSTSTLPFFRAAIPITQQEVTHPNSMCFLLLLDFCHRPCRNRYECDIPWPRPIPR